MTITIETAGFKELAADLGDASFRVTAQAALVVAKTAHDIERDAKILAPVDTGFLKNSISSDIRALTAIVGPTASYASYVEFGTSRMSPEPYMFPAAARHEDAFAKAIDQLGGAIL